jgi:hypothetical protein
MACVMIWNLLFLCNAHPRSILLVSLPVCRNRWPFRFNRCIGWIFHITTTSTILLVIFHCRLRLLSQWVLRRLHQWIGISSLSRLLLLKINIKLCVNIAALKVYVSYAEVNGFRDTSVLQRSISMCYKNFMICFHLMMTMMILIQCSLLLIITLCSIYQLWL